MKLFWCRIIATIASLLTAVLCVLPLQAADFEVTGPDGRRILLKDDKTWQYVETKETAKTAGHVLLRIEYKQEFQESCRYGVRMVNNLPYEISSLVPEFSAHKSGGVVYETVFKAFSRLRPTDTQSQEISFRLPCSEIVQVKVSGSDRCEMGELHRFSDVKGACLALIQVDEGKVVRFIK